MHKLFFFFVFISAFSFAQMPDISRVWLNEGTHYNGTIGNEKTPLKVKFLISEQNRKKDQEYFISGITVVEKSLVNFEGKLKISKYKDRKKKSAVYGNYEFAEEAKGKHSGTFKGKFIFTFDWNEKRNIIENQFIQFIGDWRSYDGTLIYKTTWSNQ